MTDDQQTRGRPVLQRIDPVTELIDEDNYRALQEAASEGKLWMFCGEYEGREPDAIDAAHARCGNGANIYKAFGPGSWPGGYLRD